MTKHLLLMLAFFVGGMQVFAQFSGQGNGTEQSPYQITSKTQLNEVRNFGTANDVYFKVMNDIDLNEGVTDRKADNWVPIPIFSGNFDGGGFQIKNIRISSGEKLGFFSIVRNSGIIKNIRLINGHIKSENSSVGSIINTVENAASIINCYNNVNLAGTSCGGICESSKGDIINCINEGNIKSIGLAGGIIGYIRSPIDGVMEISSCVNLGTIEGIKSVGGIWGNSLIESGKVSIKNCYSNCVLKGEEQIGGIAGYFYFVPGNNELIISNCLVEGSINGTGNIGGIIGKLDAPTTPIYIYDNVIALSSISSNSSTGGLTGALYGSLSAKRNYIVKDIRINSLINYNYTTKISIDDLKSKQTYSNLMENWDFTNSWTFHNNESILPIPQILNNNSYLHVLNEYREIQRTYQSSELTINLISQAPYISLSGIWSNGDLHNLKAAMGEKNSNLKEVDMSKVKLIGEIKDGLFGIFYEFNSLEKVILPEAGHSLATSFKYSFQRCPKLTTIGNLDKFTRITNLEGAFEYCTSLKTIKLPEGNEDTSITFMNAFYHCEKLENIINLEKFTSVNSFMGAFDSCYALTEITLPPGSKESQIDFFTAFKNCSNLRIIENFKEYDNNIKSLNGAFDGCTSLIYLEFSYLHKEGYSYTNLNPNCLFYITKDITGLPMGWNFNIIKTKTDGTYEAMSDITLKDHIIIDGEKCYTPFYCPYSFTVPVGKIVSYTRDKSDIRFSTGNKGWNTLILPFNNAVLKIDGKAKIPYSELSATSEFDYIVNKYSYSTTDGSLYFDFFSNSQDIIEASKPYIFTISSKLENGSIYTFEAKSDENNKVVVNTYRENMSIKDPLFTFQGEYEFSSVKSDNIYTLSSASTTDGKDCFVQTDNSLILPFHAYFSRTSTDESLKDIKTLTLQSSNIPLQIIKEPFLAGDGKTVETAYQITTKGQLANLESYLGSSGSNVYFQLMNDIDLGEGRKESDDTWFSFGSPDQPFQGILLGNGYKIKNLRITSKKGQKYVGLFGYLGNYAKIKDIHLVDGVINASADSEIHIGSIAAYIANYVTITNCSSNVDIKVNSIWAQDNYIVYCGGIVGSGPRHNTVIMYCINNGNIEIENLSTDKIINIKAGGIAGRLDSTLLMSNTNNGKLSIDNFDFEGNSNIQIGGITGYLDSSSNYLSTNTGNITASNLHKIEELYVGGITAQLNSTELNRSSNTGNITVDSKTNKSLHIGGLAGSILRKSSLKDCYSDAIIKSSNGYIGGLLGSINNTNVSLSSNYAAGSISSLSAPSLAIVGGLTGAVLGEAPSLSLSDCVSALTSLEGANGNTHRILGITEAADKTTLTRNYANSAMMGSFIGSVDLNGINKELAELKSLSFYTTTEQTKEAWDFEEVWNISPDALPILRIENEPAWYSVISWYHDNKEMIYLANSGYMDNATSIKLYGSWKYNELKKLRERISGSSSPEYENNTLISADMSNATFVGDIKDAMKNLFNKFTSLEKVIFPVKEINSEVDFLGTFMKCGKLTSVTNFDKFRKINSLSQTFQDCAQLVEITLPSVQETSAANIPFAYAFHACNKLESINLEKFTKIGNYSFSFRACSNLKTVVFPTKQESNNKSVDFYYTFDNCKELTSITNLDVYTLASNFSYAFNGCEKLQTITLPDASNSTVSDANFTETFRNCKSLKTINNLDKYPMASNFQRAFYGCEMLNNITIADGNIAREVSFSEAFFNCYNLTYLILGKNITPSLAIGAFSGTTNPNCLVYFPEGTVNTYNWPNPIIGNVATSDIAIEDGYPFYCPVSFDLGSHSITYQNRNYQFVTEDGDERIGWNTICVPFNGTLYADEDIKTPFVAGNGDYWLQKFKKIEKVDDDEVTLSFVNAFKIEANIPYLIALPGATDDDYNLSNKTITIRQTGGNVPETVLSPIGDNYTFNGSLSTTSGNNIYEFNSTKNVFEPNETGETSIKPFRAYFMAMQANPARRLILTTNDNGETVNLNIPQIADEESAINKGIKVYATNGILYIYSEKQTDITIYSSNGQKLYNIPLAAKETIEVDKLQSGIYIVAGQKVVISRRND